MTHVTCRLTAKNREQIRNPTLGNRVWASFTTKVIVIKFAECGTSSPYLSPLLLFWSNVGLLASDPSDDFQRTATLGCSAAEHPGYALHGNTLHGYTLATPRRRSMPQTVVVVARW